MKFNKLAGIADSYIPENATADYINSIRTAGVTGLPASTAKGAANAVRVIKTLFSRPDAEKLYKALEPNVFPLNKLTRGGTLLVSVNGVTGKEGRITNIVKDSNAIRNSPLFRNVAMLKNSQLFATSNVMTFVVQVQGEQPTNVVVSLSPESKTEAIFNGVVAIVTPSVNNAPWYLSYHNQRAKFQLTRRDMRFAYVNEQTTTTRAIGAQVSGVCMYTGQMVGGTIIARIPNMPANIQAVSQMVSGNVTGLRVLVESQASPARATPPLKTAG